MDSRVQTEKVHFFEYYSIEKFSDYFHSAIQYITNILFERVNLFVSLRYFQDEIILLIDFLLQSYFLKKKNSTYAEYFYGYLRNMTKNSFFPVIFLSVFQRYIRKKIQKKLSNANESNPQIKSFLKLFHLILETSDFFFNATYLLLPNSKYYSLNFFLLKQELSRLEEKQIENGMLSFISKNLVFIIFLLTKILDYSFSQNITKTNIEAIENIKPPPFKQSLETHCLICNKNWNNPTVLAVSGLVFCFGCIENFVKKHGKCPITNKHCSLNNLHRIYKN